MVPVVLPTLVRGRIALQGIDAPGHSQLGGQRARSRLHLAVAIPALEQVEQQSRRVSRVI
jgi:hypothetical protein